MWALAHEPADGDEKISLKGQLLCFFPAALRRAQMTHQRASLCIQERRGMALDTAVVPSDPKWQLLWWPGAFVGGRGRGQEKSYKLKGGNTGGR